MDNQSNTDGMHLWLVFMKAYKAMETIDRRSIQSLGVGSHSDFAILEVLFHKGPMKVSQIGKKVGLTSGSITTAVDRVEKRGWVAREPDPNDRRGVTASLTSEGSLKMQKEMALHASILESMASVLDESERETLVGLLKKIGYHAQSMLDNESRN